MLAGYMNIQDIVQHVWNSGIEIQFGQTDRWETNTFLKEWFTNKRNHEYTHYKTAGWYWISAGIDYNEMIQLTRPSTLPRNGCNFGVTSAENIRIFSESRLCTHTQNDGQVVIYNGHENNVIERLRAHFNLNSSRTGALGLKHYTLSSLCWNARVFTSNYIDLLPSNIKDDVRRIIEHPTGRLYVENTWRTYYGWPILCRS
jgi:hypothetical protein